MKLKIEKEKKLDEGLYQGTIIAIKYRETPFKYTDVVIDTNNLQLTAGYPTCVSKGSKLGLLLSRFGATLQEGKEIDPDEILVGKRCRFLVQNQITDKGTFSNVISESVKPIEVNQATFRDTTK